MALKVMGVSSKVVTLSATMSATGVMVRFTTLTTGAATPSLTENDNVEAPLKSAVGAWVRVASAALSAAWVPEKVMVGIGGAVADREGEAGQALMVMVPLLAVSTTVRLLPSTSATVRPLPPLKATPVSSGVDAETGAVPSVGR